MQLSAFSSQLSTRELRRSMKALVGLRQFHLVVRFKWFQSQREAK